LLGDGRLDRKLRDYQVKQIGYSTARLTLDGSYGEDLDRYAFDRYGLTRLGASAALGTVQFTRPTATAGGGSAVWAASGCHVPTVATRADATRTPTDTGRRSRGCRRGRGRAGEPGRGDAGTGVRVAIAKAEGRS
jgi:hypothetical protein